MIGVVSFEDKARINPADYDWVVDFWIKPYPVYYDNTNKIFRRMTDNTSQQFAGLMMWLTNCNNDYGIVIFDWLVQIKVIALQTPFFTSATRYYLGSDWNLTTTVTDIYIWKSVVDALDWSNNYNFLIEIEPNIPYWYITATNYQKAINQVVDFSQNTATQLSSKADDNNVVHKITNENIAGVKTFSDRPVFQNWINLLDANHKIYTTWWQGIYIEPFGTDRPLHIQQSTGTVELRNRFKKWTPTDWWYVNSFRIGTRYENSGITHWNMGHITQILRWDNTDANAEWSGNDWGRWLEFGSHGNPYLKFIAWDWQIGRTWWLMVHSSQSRFDDNIVIWSNAIISSTRVKNIWTSDIYALEERWDGWVVYTRMWRTTWNIMYMSQANFWWANFEFRGWYVFINWLKIQWSSITQYYNSTWAGALQLCNWDWATNNQDKRQISLWYNWTNEYMHFIRTRHNWWSATNNAIDIFLCNGTQNNTITSWSVLAMSIEWDKLKVFWQDWTSTTSFTPTATWNSGSWAILSITTAQYCEKWNMAWVSVRAGIVSKGTCSWVFIISSPTTVNNTATPLSGWIYAIGTWPNSSKWRVNTAWNCFTFTKSSQNSNTTRSDIAVNDEILIQWRYLK